MARKVAALGVRCHDELFGAKVAGVPAAVGGVGRLC